MTKIEFFIVAFNKTMKKFDDIALQKFLSCHEVSDVVINYFLLDKVPHHSVVVVYQSEVVSSVNKKKTARNIQSKKKNDRYKQLGVNKEDELFYNKLKEWRLIKAQEVSSPAYIIFNDAELERIVATKPTTREEFSSIVGVGPVKTEKYGYIITQMVKNYIHGKNKEKN